MSWIDAAVQDRLTATAGVRGVAAIGRLDSESPAARRVVDARARSLGPATIIDVSTSYFATLGIRAIRGAVFTDADAVSNSDAIVLSESLARVLAIDGDPLGGVVRLAGDLPSAAPQRLRRGAADSLRRRPGARRPHDARDRRWRRRAAGRRTPNALGGAPRHGVALSAARRDRDQPRGGRAPARGGGIYAVVAFVSTRRAREFGIRMALGVTRADIMSLLVLGGFRPVACGGAAGIFVAAIAARVLARLFERTPVRLDAADPVPFAAVALVLMGTAVAATITPAYRAASGDPVAALRQE
jgi:putative ABC transport system permease protein